MRMRFKSILFLITILILSNVVLGAFYFVYKNYISYGADIKISGPLSINYLEGSKVRGKGDKVIKFSIINDSEEDAYYFIEYKNPKNIEKSIKYTLTDGKNTLNGEIKPYNTIITNYVLLPAGEIENYTLTLQAEDSFTYRFELNIANESLETNTFAEVILKNSEIKKSPLTEPGKEIATTDEGLIKSTDDYGVTYYFRGNVENNNVLIGDRLFKIVRVNGDGTVRLVLDGAAEEVKRYYESPDKYTFKESLVYDYLNMWVTANLSYYTKYLANHKYCNDNSMEDDNFLALSRIKKDNIISYVCLGDKVLSKVGLLTVDEAIFAGATLNDENKDFYLYNSEVESNSYLMTSASKTSSGYYPFMISAKGKIIANDTGKNYRSVRPVITIIKTATVTGDGTVNNPYVLTQ